MKVIKIVWGASAHRDGDSDRSDLSPVEYAERSHRCNGGS